MPNANIDYVTSHQGTAHITTQNVIDLLAGIRGDISGVQRFPDLYNGLAHSITDVRAIQIKTGAALAGGSFFILEDAFDWLLDAGAVGYSRIDILYLVMYEDLDTQVQSCDFVYQKGTNYVNGGTGTEPSAPTGTNITATYPIMKVVITDSAIANVTDCVEDYLSNDDLVTQVAGTVNQVTTNKNNIATLQTSKANTLVVTQYTKTITIATTPSSNNYYYSQQKNGYTPIAWNVHPFLQGAASRCLVSIDYSATPGNGLFSVSYGCASNAAGSIEAIIQFDITWMKND